ncbi:ornithine carbamoyltransferase [Thermodesulfobacterium sp. TA1]|uniref:ornithine carbamoyltransferase n=1 Tax=Thermodesulfobacterium sp. TA1 TaxID=2234087 RepID=UPI0012318715|nr:ornithine carbamoyltransferase [Thermodesulfobacterium sp. TA1]QER42213.1 ornithine carbamoyltransferase [Thermodesulfobacterium sp. TA1]
MGIRHFLRISDLAKEEILSLFSRAIGFKHKGYPQEALKGKILGLIFEKPSTRTRLSFESAMIKLGGSSLFLSARDLQLTRGEPIKDTARVLSRYLDVLVLRTYSHQTIQEFAKHATIPVINGLSDFYHPCQALSDVLTVIEKGRDLTKEKVVWIGDGNNVAHSWIEAAAILGFKITVASPPGYEPSKELIEELRQKYNLQVEILNDPKEAVKGATIINTDVWVSMGQDEESQTRKKVFQPFQVNSDLLKLASPEAMVLHCLPAHRGEEITEEVLEGEHSVVWDQAENKMWFHMALLEFLLKCV